MVTAEDGKDGKEETAAAAAPTGQPEAKEIEKVQRCLEELLSKQNLTEDSFIQQHMNAQMFVPLCILAGHHRLTRLSTKANVATLLAAAKLSDKLGVDEESLLVRPLLKSKRNTLILHDLPEDVEEHELRALLEGCAEVTDLISVKPDVNRTAFLTFLSDEAAQKAALWLRSKQLRGSAVQCSVKAEHAMRSFFPMMPGTPPRMAMAYPNQMMWASMSQWSGQWQNMEMWEGGGGGCDPAWMGSMFPDADMKGGKSKGKGCPGPKGKGKGKGKGKPEAAAVAPEGATEAPQMDVAQAAEGFAQWASEAGYGQGEDDLLEPEEGPGIVDDSDLGYTHQFRQYSREEIVAICNRMASVPKPESFQRFECEEADVNLFRSTPCKDWAPAPTPQMGFAPGGYEGQRKGGGGEASATDSPNVEGGKPPRKGSAMSRSSWSSSRRSRSTSRARREGGEAEEFAGGNGGWEWDEWCGGEWGADSSQRWGRRRNSWNDWYSSGPQWVEKAKLDEQRDEAKGISWAQRVKGRDRSASAGAQQRWQAKSRAEDGGVQPDAKAESNAGEGVGEEAPTQDADKKDEETNKASKADDETETPAAKPSAESTGATESKAPTWADKVRQSASKAAGKVA